MATYFGDLSHAADFVTLAVAISSDLDGFLRTTNLPPAFDTAGGNVCNLLLDTDLQGTDGEGSYLAVDLGVDDEGPWVEVFRIVGTGAGRQIVPLTWPKLPGGRTVTHARVWGGGSSSINRLFVALLWLKKHPEPAGGADGRAPVIN